MLLWRALDVEDCQLQGFNAAGGGWRRFRSSGVRNGWLRQDGEELPLFLSLPNSRVRRD